METGGFLLGHLRRARESGDVFVEITDYVPAAHTERHPTRLVFSPETWRHVRGVIELRNLGELLCAWLHSHPNFCARCPAEARARCAYRLPFFSEEDVDVHASCFPRAWQSALLVSDVGEPERRLTCYGWRGGIVVERGLNAFEGGKDANR